jgi:hypothetical protein
VFRTSHEHRSRGSRRPPSVNLRENLFRVPDRVRDGVDARGNSRRTLVLTQLPRREDGGGDQQHALATLFLSRSDSSLALCSASSWPRAAHLFSLTLTSISNMSRSRLSFLYGADSAGRAGEPLGTGFIVLVPVASNPGRVYKLLVTARHMVDPQWAGCPVAAPTKIFLRVNKKNFDPSKNEVGSQSMQWHVGRTLFQMQ